MGFIFYELELLRFHLLKIEMMLHPLNNVWIIYKLLDSFTYLSFFTSDCISVTLSVSSIISYPKIVSRISSSVITPVILS
jgi:hypothetical protein